MRSRLLTNVWAIIRLGNTGMHARFISNMYVQYSRSTYIVTRISCFVGDIVIHTLIDAAIPSLAIRRLSVSCPDLPPSFKLLLFSSKMEGRREAHGKYNLPSPAVQIE